MGTEIPAMVMVEKTEVTWSDIEEYVKEFEAIGFARFAFADKEKSYAFGMEVKKEEGEEDEGLGGILIRKKENEQEGEQVIIGFDDGKMTFSYSKPKYSLDDAGN